jgi:uncharacterized protein YpbB
MYLDNLILIFPLLQMSQINIGILLDACGIPYTEKQLAKLEKLVNNFIKLQVNNSVKNLVSSNQGCRNRYNLIDS